MKNIFICTHACPLRSLDAKRICNYLSKNEYKIVDKPKDADIIIFVTCAFTNEMAEFCLNKVKEFQEYDAELIVAGCLPGIEKEDLVKIFDGKTLTTKNLDKDIERLFPPQNKIEFKDIDDANILFENLDEGDSVEAMKKIFRKVRWMENIYIKIKNHLLKNLLGEHSPLYVKVTKKSFYRIRISVGCLGNCSYCAIKKGIGPLKSKPLDQCIRELRTGLKNGHKEFIAVADDTGAYGLDMSSSFPELLDNITKIPGEYKISIGSTDPRWLVRYVDELEEILKRRKIISLDIALQSANSRILKLMHRYPNVEKIKDAIIRLKKSFPDLHLYTHIIVGFPTETRDEFKQSLSFIKERSFSGGLILPFSCKTGTKAENIEPKISEKEIYKRLKYTKKFLKNVGYNAILFKTKTPLIAFGRRE